MDSTVHDVNSGGESGHVCIITSSRDPTPCMQNQAVDGVSSKTPVLPRLWTNWSGDDSSPAFVPELELVLVYQRCKSSGTALVRKSQRMNSFQRKPEDMCLCQFGLREISYGHPIRRHRGERTEMSLWPATMGNSS